MNKAWSWIMFNRENYNLYRIVYRTQVEGVNKLWSLRFLAGLLENTVTDT